MRTTAKTLEALRRLKHLVCGRLLHAGHQLNTSNAVTRELLEQAFRIALSSQGVSLDGAWHGAKELVQSATPNVVRGWLDAYSERDWTFSHLHRSIENAAHGHRTVKFAYECMVWECREHQFAYRSLRRFRRRVRLAYPSLSTFQRRVRIERQLAKTLERILDRQAKRNRALERERALMPDASDFINRILDVAEAEGVHVVRRIRS